MARTRVIKPGFFKNEDIVELPFEYRLLFVGLWTLADREGRLEDRPKRIKMELFPADNVDVDHGLGELVRYGFIERYEADGVRVVTILKFAEHQKPHSTEKASELPGKDRETHQENGTCHTHSDDLDTSKTPAPHSDNGEKTLDNGEKTLRNGQYRPCYLLPDTYSLDTGYLLPDSTTGTSPVVPRAQAHATQPSAPPVDNPEKPCGFPNTPIEKPKENYPVSSKPSGKQADKPLRGSRLPDDWRLPKDWGDWAIAERPDLSADDVRRESACFADYWHAKAGADARKVDWAGTWRNWIRRAHARPHDRPHNLMPDGSIQLVRDNAMQSANLAKQLIFRDEVAA